MNYHVGTRFQRGKGLGAIFSGLMRGFAPIARKGLEIGKKVLNSSIVKKVANTALESGKKAALNLAADLLEGKDLKTSAENELNEAKNKIAGTLRGQGSRKRKRNCKRNKNKNTKKSKRSKKYHLFDS